MQYLDVSSIVFFSVEIMQNSFAIRFCMIFCIEFLNGCPALVKYEKGRNMKLLFTKGNYSNFVPYLSYATILSAS